MRAFEFPIPDRRARSGRHAARIAPTLDLGVNFLDAANVCSDGTREEIVGRPPKEFAPRDAIVPADPESGGHPVAGRTESG